MSILFYIFKIYTFQDNSRLPTMSQVPGSISSTAPLAKQYKTATPKSTFLTVKRICQNNF